LRTRPIAEVERNSDLVALGHVLDLVADRNYSARGFVTEDLARIRLDAEPVPLALPAVPIAPTDTTRLPFDHRTRRVGIGCVHVLNVERFAVLFEDSCMHTSYDNGGQL